MRGSEVVFCVSERFADRVSITYINTLLIPLNCFSSPIKAQVKITVILQNGDFNSQSWLSGNSAQEQRRTYRV